MLTRVILNAQQCGQLVVRHFRRNIGISAVLSQKTAAKLDPIQQLFVEKVREYGQKSKTSGTGLVEASPEDNKNLTDNLDKITRAYSADKEDFTKFPTFSFADPELKPVSAGRIESKAVEMTSDASETAEKDEDLAFYEH